MLRKLLQLKHVFKQTCIWYNNLNDLRVNHYMPHLHPNHSKGMASGGAYPKNLFQSRFVSNFRYSWKSNEILLRPVKWTSKKATGTYSKLILRPKKAEANKENGQKWTLNQFYGICVCRQLDLGPIQCVIVIVNRD